MQIEVERQSDRGRFSLPALGRMKKEHLGVRCSSLDLIRLKAVRLPTGLLRTARLQNSAMDRTAE